MQQASTTLHWDGRSKHQLTSRSFVGSSGRAQLGLSMGKQVRQITGPLPVVWRQACQPPGCRAGCGVGRPGSLAGVLHLQGPACQHIPRPWSCACRLQMHRCCALVPEGPDRRGLGFEAALQAMLCDLAGRCTGFPRGFCSRCRVRHAAATGAAGHNRLTPIKCTACKPPAGQGLTDCHRQRGHIQSGALGVSLHARP